MTFTFRAAAARDVAEAYAWYERERAGLGEEYLHAVGDAAGRVAEDPLRHPLVRGDVRRALVPRFPYALFYRVIGTEVAIVACLHHRRAPARWQGRR